MDEKQPKTTSPETRVYQRVEADLPNIIISPIPPNVAKVDGKARVLPPQRQMQQPGQQVDPRRPITQPGIVRTSLPHSASMPSLQRTSTTPSTSAALTPSDKWQSAPSATLIPWAEKMKAILGRLRGHHSKVLAIVMQKPEENIQRDHETAKKYIDKSTEYFNSLVKLTNLTPRSTMIIEKQKLLKSLTNAIDDKHISSTDFTFMPRVENSVEYRIAIDHNLSLLYDSMRFIQGCPRRRKLLAQHPPILRGRIVEEGKIKVLKVLESYLHKLKTEQTCWKFCRIPHKSYRTTKILVEVKYSMKRLSNDSSFVPSMKALMVIKCGVLEDVVIGSVEEDLYDEESILPSRYNIYRAITRVARKAILSTSVTELTSTANFGILNNYIQQYVNCFTQKCHYCKKHLRDYNPPNMVTKDSPPIIAHDICYITCTD